MANQIVTGQTFDEERALYGSDGIEVVNCRFDGPADGESALKESKNVAVKDCFFNLRYPFWHDDNLTIENSEMTDKCRAALWYTNNAVIRGTKMHGIKALRECGEIRIEDSSIISPEFGWSVNGIDMKNTSAEGEYFMMRSDRLHFENVTLKGKYSFQYITDSVFENCNFDTKDAFWHAKNVVVRNSVIKGEYLAWYCENVTFENCTISGTQPLCYCKGLKLINCKMLDADLAFEKSEVEATITTPMISIKNPKSGRISVPAVDELIMDDPAAKGEVVVA
jgi:polygalacturonase